MIEWRTARAKTLGEGVWGARVGPLDHQSDARLALSIFSVPILLQVGDVHSALPAKEEFTWPSNGKS